MIMTLYHMWLVRNAARESRNFVNFYELTILDEWLEVKASKGTTPAVQKDVRWEPPEERWIKINVDGSLNNNGSGGGA